MDKQPVGDRMGKRSITDHEIALIKAMLNQGMKNKDIQFFFNRPDRSVNSGRITDILNGNYSDSKDIAAATFDDLKAFIDEQIPSETGVRVEAQAPPKPFSHSDHVQSLFEKDVFGIWRLRDGETDQHECKHEFDPKKLSQIIRAIAALSNNKGGYVLVGVKDDLSCDNCQPFHDTDIAHIMDKLKYFLSPSPVVTTKSGTTIGDKEIGFIHVEAHPDRPVIVYRDGDKLAEGEILFRYAGQSSRIKFGDLRTMLDERDRRARMAFVSAAGRLAEIHPTSALVIDTDKNVLDAEGKQIFIDESLVQKLKFIKEGEFVEKDGAPTLRLVGEVSQIGASTIIQGKVAREAIFQEHILQDFLDQADVDDPMQYIIAGVGQPRNWQPIFYYARLAQKTNTEILKELKSLKNLPKGKLRFITERLSGKKGALSKPASTRAKLLLAEIIGGKISTPANDVEAIAFAQAIISLPDGQYPNDLLLKNLAGCRELVEDCGKVDPMGWVFKAACRLDEMLYLKDATTVVSPGA